MSEKRARPNMDYDELHTLAQAIWMYIQNENDATTTRRAFRDRDGWREITVNDKGIYGAIARLAVFFDEYVDTGDDDEPDGIDECPACHSRNTERIDTISDDPVIWIVQCGACGETFEVLIAPDETPRAER